MTHNSRAARLTRRLSFWFAAGVALLASHDAVFLVQLGPGHALANALRDAGHGYWGAASALLLLGGGVGAAIWLTRLRALRQVAGNAPQPAYTGGWKGRVLSHWIRLFALVVVAFALQESVEHVLSHGHGIGLGALIGPEYPLALPVLAAVTGLAAALTSLVRHQEVELQRRIAASLAEIRRSPRVIGLLRPNRESNIRGTLMSLHRALRAPPAVSLLTHI